MGIMGGMGLMGTRRRLGDALGFRTVVGRDALIAGGIFFAIVRAFVTYPARGV
jgi:hypothetical protein